MKLSYIKDTKTRLEFYVNHYYNFRDKWGLHFAIIALRDFRAGRIHTEQRPILTVKKTVGVE